MCSTNSICVGANGSFDNTTPCASGLMVAFYSTKILTRFYHRMIEDHITFLPTLLHYRINYDDHKKCKKKKGTKVIYTNGRTCGEGTTVCGEKACCDPTKVIETVNQPILLDDPNLYKMYTKSIIFNNTKIQQKLLIDSFDQRINKYLKKSDTKAILKQYYDLDCDAYRLGYRNGLQQLEKEQRLMPNNREQLGTFYGRIDRERLLWWLNSISLELGWRRGSYFVGIHALDSFLLNGGGAMVDGPVQQGDGPLQEDPLLLGVSALVLGAALVEDYTTTQKLKDFVRGLEISTDKISNYQWMIMAKVPLLSVGHTPEDRLWCFLGRYAAHHNYQNYDKLEYIFELTMLLITAAYLDGIYLKYTTSELVAAALTPVLASVTQICSSHEISRLSLTVYGEDIISVLSQVTPVVFNVFDKYFSSDALITVIHSWRIVAAQFL